jgi:hypothetical protein
MQVLEDRFAISTGGQPMTTPLSPAAQAVRDAFFSGPDDFTASIAAALRAAADQVVPVETEPDNAFEEEGYVPGRLREQRQDTRAAFLSLANELDPTPTTPLSPTIEPVPVSERPWEREKGWNDPDGECWWCPPDGPPYWQMANPAMVYGGWLLPHHALPLPTP